MDIQLEFKSTVIAIRVPINHEKYAFLYYYLPITLDFA